MPERRAVRLGVTGFAVALASVIPGWIHTTTGQDSSVWLVLAFAVFGVGFLIGALGLAVGVADEMERRRKS
jgi:hypothetical protein